MKKIIILFSSLLTFTTLFYSINSHAAFGGKSPFYVEPYAGYFIGKLESDDIIDGDIKSLYYGARIGIETARGYIFGFDYGQGNGDFDADNSSNSDGDYEQKDLGAFIGYRINPMVRIYGSYIFKFEAEYDRDNNTDFDIEGDGFNAGISIKAAPKLKIGLEYQIRNYKEFGNGTNIPGSDDKSTTYLLTFKLPVPMPFNIR